MTTKPIAECTREDLQNNHALVYGRCRIWYHDLTDSGPTSHWSRWGWWKAMWYSHRAAPCYPASWGIYAGHTGYTGPGDAQITHFQPIPETPDGAPVGDDQEWKPT